MTTIGTTQHTPSGTTTPTTLNSAGTTQIIKPGTSQLPSPFQLKGDYKATTILLAELNSIQLKKEGCSLPKGKEDKANLEQAWRDYYRELYILHTADQILIEQLRKENQELKQNQQPKKVKKVKPPPPKEYWLNKWDEDNEQWGWHNKDFDEYVESLTKKELLTFCKEGNSENTTYSEETREELFLKKSSKVGQSKAEKIARCKKSQQNCKVPDELRCEHCVPVQGTGYKEFQRCCKKSTHTISNGSLTRKICYSHYKGLSGVANNQARESTEFRSNNKEIMMKVEGSWIEGGIQDLLENGGMGGFYTNTPEQLKERYSDIKRRRNYLFSEDNKNTRVLNCGKEFNLENYLI